VTEGSKRQFFRLAFDGFGFHAERFSHDDPGGTPRHAAAQATAAPWLPLDA